MIRVLWNQGLTGKTLTPDHRRGLWARGFTSLTVNIDEDSMKKTFFRVAISCVLSMIWHKDECMKSAEHMKIWSGVLSFGCLLEGGLYHSIRQSLKNSHDEVNKNDNVSKGINSWKAPGSIPSRRWSRFTRSISAKCFMWEQHDFSMPRNRGVWSSYLRIFQWNSSLTVTKKWSIILGVFVFAFTGARCGWWW